MPHFSVARFGARRVLKGAARRALEERITVRSRRGSLQEVGVEFGGVRVSFGVPPQFDSFGDLPL